MRARAAALTVLTVLVVVAAGACQEDDPALDVGTPTSTTTVPSVRPPGPTECPRDAAPDQEETLNGSIEVSWDEPVMAGGPVTWTLAVTSGADEPVTLVFSSGQDGDVVLERDGSEAYRWSSDMFFTEAIRCIDLAPGATLTVELNEQALDVEPGDYTLRATLAASPAPPPAERPITVQP